MKFIYKTKSKIRILLFLLMASLVFGGMPLQAFATMDEYLEEAEERKNDPVESNEVPNWPTGPAIGAEAAILMDANTGAILYAKNIHAILYPASTTKIMTSLVAIENSDLNEIVTVSQSAIDANAPDGSNMGLVAGEQLTMEELLYGILIKSANEGCNAVAEHICGDTDTYVARMNERAIELGCQNTHFVTTNGLHDENHYTTAYDLALIAREFFSYDILCKMSNTSLLILEENAYHGEHYLQSHNKLLEGQTYAYEYLLGSKTGFTSDSRQTLVSCAEYNGLKLICVILKEESPYQFEDTIALFDYGFANFSPVNIAANETGYQVNHTDFFDSETDIFGSTAPLISIDRNANIVLPNGFEFSDVTSTLTYEGDSLARIDYTYHSLYLGSAEVVLSISAADRFQFSEEDIADAEANAADTGHVIINVRHILIFLVGLLAVVILGIILFYRLRASYGRKKRLREIRKRNSSTARRREALRRNAPARRRPMRRRPSTPSKTRQKNKRRPPVKRSSPRNTGWEKRNDINFKDFDL